jgi:hypothetical protein
MNDPLKWSIAHQISKLKEKVLSFNKKGNLHGLFSCHILSDLSSQLPEWSVACNDKDWIKKTFNKDNVYDVAELGYSIFLNHNADQKAFSAFTASLDNLKKRDLFSGSHVTFPYNPLVFLGLVLGLKKSTNIIAKKSYFDWLLSVLEERKKRGNISSFQNVFYKYIEAEIKGKSITITVPENGVSLEDISFYEWGIRRGFFALSNSPLFLERSRSKILDLLIRHDIDQVEPEKAPLILAATHFSIEGGIDKLVKSPSLLISILSKFEAAMKRWRYDSDSSKSPKKWAVNSEKEVQDILWLILRPYFDDIVDEETLPKLGHSSYKPDFAIPSLRTLIEVKFAKKKADFKDIEKEIMQDSVGYLTNTTNYEKILVFIYDHSSSSQEHAETIRALRNVSGIENVVIVSKPSQLPS